jgi:hypothetical protein
MHSTISVTTKIGESGGDAFPILERIWDVYSGKGIRTVFLSIGSSKAALPDLEIAETLGCPLNIVALNSSESEAWAEVSKILKERRREPTASPFSIGAETKWILPKNLRVQNTMPWWQNGLIDISGVSIRTENFKDFMGSIATTMKLKDNANRVDILKIDTVSSAPGLEIPLLGAMLNTGYRPATVIVRWSKMPDIDLSTTLAAGHLQNAGYSLFGKVDDKFLYYYTDQDLYQICSWEEVTVNNPMMLELMKSLKRGR